MKAILTDRITENNGIPAESVQAAFKEHRQRLSVAKAELEQTLGKSFCPKTLADFVKKTVGVIKRIRKRPRRSETLEREPLPEVYALKNSLPHFST